MENRSIHDDVWLAPWDPEWAHEFHMEKQCIVGSMMAEALDIQCACRKAVSLPSLQCSSIISARTACPASFG